ncbi:prephenate dehydratase [Vagococcus carniphilus]|uniref:prephenate dehydratase n=1 Tax=Vagococcus carniphilus TaxID=218144 RepID=UPI00288F63E3|nr:prephenate dehydratase [Vagococcus carniphilus]MDT2847688.1 prephenate dehydratase [Vagococcus carniphilus]
MRVGYLGPKSSFTYKATKNFFKEAELSPLPTIVSTLKAIEMNQFDYCVIPIENSVEGTVHPALDFLYHQGNVPVQAEVILPISQNLMIHPNWIGKINQLKIVKSHPQALAQTQQFLEENYSSLKQEITDSTTQAAKWISDNKDEPVMAIASKEAAKEYRLEIIQSDIQDMKTNQTRFWVIGRKKTDFYKEKSSIFRQTIGVKMEQNQAGNLHKILSAFSWRGIDLTKIESRPLKTRLGDYFFLIDIKVENLMLVEMALQEITELGGEIKDFGTYYAHQPINC